MRSLLLTICTLIGATTSAQETKTSIGFALSPNYSSIRYIDGDLPVGYVDDLESGTKGSLGLSGNIFFQYETTKNLFFTWGLGIQNYRYMTTYYSQEQIDHPTIVSNTKYSQHYIQLSASVKYRIYKTLYVRAGIGADILAEQHARITQSCPTCESFSQGNDNSPPLKTALVPATFGIGYELKLNDKLNLMSELFGTMSLTGAYEEISSSSYILQQRPLQLGLSLGIIRSF